MPLPFQGTAWALSTDGLAAVTEALGVHPPEIWAVLSVETSGCGYLPDRPQILYERHIFHRLTHGQFDDRDISAPTSGGYGARSTHQYDRLAAAIEKDCAAALQSTSWGIGQIMGTNHVLAGFQNVEEMIAAMCESEDRQLAAVSSFLQGTNLQATLQAHDWPAFARGYNGPNYAINRYDVRLNKAFQKYAAGHCRTSMSALCSFTSPNLDFIPEGLTVSQEPAPWPHWLNSSRNANSRALTPSAPPPWPNSSPR